MGIRLRGGQPDSQPSPMKRKRALLVPETSAFGGSSAQDSLGPDGGATSPRSLVEGRQSKLARTGLSAEAIAAEDAKEGAQAKKMRAAAKDDPCISEPLAHFRVVIKPHPGNC
jgi:hypothetical protein